MKVTHHSPRRIKVGDVVYITGNQYLVQWDTIDQHYILLPLFLHGRVGRMSKL